MFKKLWFVVAAILFLGVTALAQSTSGLITGTVLDGSGASVAGVAITIINQGTNEQRAAVSDANGHFIVPQLAPGMYSVSTKAQGFAKEKQSNIQLQVNQSVTLEFKMQVSSVEQTIEITEAPPQINATSATLGDVVTHEAVVDLPLNGRQFTQLTFLSPGAVPQQAGQQTNNLVPVGAGGLVPSVDGQRPRQNNFTMDGVQNNFIFANTWAISPPPDALQEFNVQTHITDAQFAISSGANINIATRSGTNTFHGALWEFLRNSVLDAQTFPATTRLPYEQNQYGLFFGGPVVIPRWSGKDNTWFAAYWEGYRSRQSKAAFAIVPTAAMIGGDFRGLPNIYDPNTTTCTTSGTPPVTSCTRTQFSYMGNLNVIDPSRLNHASALILQKYYPAPNIPNAAPNTNNLSFAQRTVTSNDQAGIRIDHRFGDNDTLFGRYNRDNINQLRPDPLPTQSLTATEFAEAYAIGYMHLFNAHSILNLHVGYTHTNFGRGETPAGPDFVAALNMALANPEHDGVWYGPSVTIANGYATENQTTTRNGPQESFDYHLDYTKILGSHTLSGGAMYYHIRTFGDGHGYTLNFTANATSINGSTTSGLGPASFVLGLPGSYLATLGNTSGDLTVNWYGGYVQDQWQATKNLVLTAGLRWDVVMPPNYHKIISALNPLNGQFLINGAVPPNYPAATAPAGIFNPQYNGFQPRFGATYSFSRNTVIHAAFAMLDDHNNSLAQEEQDLRVSWPNAVSASVSNINQGVPTVFFDQLPPESYFLNSAPFYIGFATNPDNKIPYSMEYNFGVQQQLPFMTSLSVDYVGSASRHLNIGLIANTATTPGPGTLASRGQPFPQYGGGTFTFDSNEGSSSYNALQAKLKKTISSGLYFLASYTWSKTLDIQSDAYATPPQNLYKLQADWGPADFDRRNMFVFSGIYQLPFGKGRKYLAASNALVQGLAGGWNFGGIVSMVSGQPFNGGAGGDVANVGGGTQRANKNGSAYSGTSFQQGKREVNGSVDWVNPASFAVPTQYTFGNERRNDLIGPSYKDVDAEISKNFSLPKSAILQFRTELFNAFNKTNYANPAANRAAATFGQISAANGTGREVQFALKITF